MSDRAIAQIMGNLVRDGELKYTNSGVPMLKFTVAVNRTIKDDKRTAFIPVLVWSKYAEALAPMAKKGTRATVFGELTESRWEDSQGAKHSRIEITADSVEFGVSRGVSSPGEGSDDTPF